MLTIYTQTAIAVLHDIASGDYQYSANFLLSKEELAALLRKLENKGLVRILPDCEEGVLPSYELCRPRYEISLLDVLEATGEPIHCNTPTPESYYANHGEVARKIGVLNHMARLFLSEIKMTDW